MASLPNGANGNYSHKNRQAPSFLKSGACIIIYKVYQFEANDIWLIRYERFEVNSFTEMASRIIPKNLRVKYTPPLPMAFWMTAVALSIMNTTTAFSISAERIFTDAYSAFSERSVVNEPAPASGRG